MKNIHKIILSILALLLLPAIGVAQYSYTVKGTINSGEPSEVVDALSAKVDIEFFDSNGIEGFDVIKVTVQNTTVDLLPGPVDLGSLVSAFYIRKPMGDAPQTPQGNDEGQNDLVNGDFPSAIVDVGNPNFLVTSDPSNWILDTDGSDELKNFNGNWDMTNYFGAHAGTRLAEAPAPPGVFYFSFDDFELAGPYEDDEAPMVFVRWQSIYLNEVLYDESGKGAGGTPGWEQSVVPEPSEVALMAILGLGGLLWTRRRFVKK